MPECHSTNSLLYELNHSSALPEGTVVITDNQTTGRGQRGNKWEADPGLNLTFSVLLRPLFLEAKDQFQLNMAVSMAVVDALTPYVPSIIKLKWPNDIFIENKKIGGILIENQLQGMLISDSIVGIGLNINQVFFSSSNASSILNFSRQVNDLDEVFQNLMESIEAEYVDLRYLAPAELKERYLNSLYKLNEPHLFESSGENFTGSISDVDENGRLCVETERGRKVFSFKEVKFLN